ncbi:proton-coupled amino acid transporter 4-like [Helicoverpa zea]|uniref:proton-coupled amino acid transporter 4-like n=1 Tax=Helicoverpa zea TaxID=7113 RepID=UPI001F560A81|nr:proton-coupled amino acid transporter 4-like [Helicoverpa zea]
MPKKKVFFVYGMTPTKDNQRTNQVTGSQRAEESSSGPPDASTSANANQARIDPSPSTDQDQSSTSGQPERTGQPSTDQPTNPSQPTATSPNQLSSPNQPSSPNQRTSPNQPSSPNQSLTPSQSGPPSRPPSRQLPPHQAPLPPSIRIYSDTDIEMFIGSTSRALAAPSRPYRESSPTGASLPSSQTNRATFRHLAHISANPDPGVDFDRSPTPSLYTLDRDIKNYIHKRESHSYEYYPGTERTVYDYIEERNDMYNTNLIESTAHLIKGSLGAGALSMHEAYMYGGLWTSLVVTIVIGITISYTMLMLIRSAQKVYRRLRISKLSYPDLAEAACATSPWRFVRKLSKPFRYLVDACIIFEMCGTCCIYQIMIGSSIKQMFEGIDYEFAKRVMGIRLYILISAPILLPLCQIRSLKFLAPFSMLADVFVALCVLTTLYYSLITLNANITDRYAWKNIHGFFRIAGICMYTTSGICVALPVENNMKRPRYFPQAVRLATIVVLTLTVTTGVFGYWAWGESCKSPITVHMPLNIFTTILQFLLIMMLSTSFAVQFWVPFRIIWHYLVRRYKRKQAIWERVHRLIMGLIVMAFTMLFPNVISVMIFLGQFFMGLVALVFPATIEIMVDWEEAYSHRAR